MFWPHREVIGSMTVFCAQKNAASPVVYILSQNVGCWKLSSTVSRSRATQAGLQAQAQDTTRQGMRCQRAVAGRRIAVAHLRAPRISTAPSRPNSSSSECASGDGSASGPDALKPAGRQLASLSRSSSIGVYCSPTRPTATANAAVPTAHTRQQVRLPEPTVPICAVCRNGRRSARRSLDRGALRVARSTASTRRLHVLSGHVCPVCRPCTAPQNQRACCSPSAGVVCAT